MISWSEIVRSWYSSTFMTAICEFVMMKLLSGSILCLIIVLDSSNLEIV